MRLLINQRIFISKYFKIKTMHLWSWPWVVFCSLVDGLDNCILPLFVLVIKDLCSKRVVVCCKWMLVCPQFFMLLHSFTIDRSWNLHQNWCCASQYTENPRFDFIKLLHAMQRKKYMDKLIKLCGGPIID